VYAQRLLRASLLMPGDLGDEEGKLICSQLDTAFRENKRRQIVEMDFLFPLYFFPFLFLLFFVGTSHELAVVAIFLHVPQNNT
jgi:hypothetical protein